MKANSEIPADQILFSLSMPLVTLPLALLPSHDTVLVGGAMQVGGGDELRADSRDQGITHHGDEGEKSVVTNEDGHSDKETCDDGNENQSAPPNRARLAGYTSEQATCRIS